VGKSAYIPVKKVSVPISVGIVPTSPRVDKYLHPKKGKLDRVSNWWNENENENEKENPAKTGVPHKSLTFPVVVQYTPG